MKKSLSLFIVAFVFGLIISCKKERGPENAMQSPYISRIIEYAPAPGQFINDDSYGTRAKVKDLVGGVDNGLLSLGGFGGYIIFAFDHAISNGDGYDLGIFSNPLISAGAEWSEPGIVMVSRDDNKNGIADDAWYELAGSEYHKPGTIKNYQIIYTNPKNLTDDIQWRDNQGKTGVILRNGFHTQSYFPQERAAETEITFTGTLLVNTLKDGGIITNQPFDFGYADNGSAEYLDLQNSRGRGYNAFDISWAVDASGRPVTLDRIDFVKVYTAQNCNGNPYTVTDNPRSRYLGEISTEIGGAIDISLYNKLK